MKPAELLKLPLDDQKIPYLRRVTSAVQKVGGINLGQGTCQLPTPPEVLEAARRGMAEGHNRYTLPRGMIEAREAVAAKLKAFNRIDADPETEILITAGVTGGFEAVCRSLLRPGDEVICFEPYYPYHHNGLEASGATIRYVTLRPPEWRFDLDELERAISPRTRFLLLNTPSNPSGKVFSLEELRAIGSVCERRNVMVVTDEIYEYLTFDGREHVSAASLPEFEGRTITLGGYSKTFAVTGWRIGYVVAPEAIATSLAQVLDAVYICAPAPFQFALSAVLGDLGTDFYERLRAGYERKVEYFSAALERAGFSVWRPEGAYYIIADYSRLAPSLTSYEFVTHMIERARVGAVPSNDFVRSHETSTWVRFCVAVEEAVLKRAAEQLMVLNGTPHRR